MTGRPPLWAPWRMEYIERHGEDRACIFCALDDERDDRERLVLHRGREAFVLLNRFPYAAGHVMVAPYAHEAKLDGLARAAQVEIMSLLASSSRLLERALQCEGLNLGANLGMAAGAGFADHLHFHLVPRWVGDTNFMTVLAETRVIPQHLEQSYAALAPLFEALET